MSEEIAQNHKDIALLLAAGGNHCLQAGIHLCPAFSVKAATHFLLDFGRAQVAFGLVIVKRHLKIIHKSQCLTFAQLQMIQQVLGRMLFGLAPFLGWLCVWQSVATLFILLVFWSRLRQQPEQLQNFIVYFIL